MTDEKLSCALPLIFREVNVPEHAKLELRRRLFGGNALSDDELTLVSAAGDLSELRNKNKDLEE